MKNEKYVPNGIRGEPEGKIKKYPMMNIQYRISNNDEQRILTPFRQLAERVGVGLINIQ